MIVAAALLGYAAVLTVAGPAWLVRADWPTRAPRLAIAGWQALSVAVLTAVVLAGLALAVPTGAGAGGLAGWLGACLMALREGYAAPGGALVAAVGLLAATAITGRTAGCLIAGLLRAGRQRRVHADALTLLARRAPALGAVVLEHATAAAYCLPGRHRRIVLTTAALLVLHEDELAAVLAHERAHLTGRHHLVLAFAEALHRAFPGLPLFARAYDQIAQLVEMRADDVAGAGHGRMTVAAALAALAGGGAPAAALAAGGSTALARAGRLLGPARPLRVRSLLAGFTLAAAVAALPAALVAAPAVAASQMPPCPGAHTRTSATVAADSGWHDTASCDGCPIAPAGHPIHCRTR